MSRPRWSFAAYHASVFFAFVQSVVVWQGVKGLTLSVVFFGLQFGGELLAGTLLARRTLRSLVWLALGFGLWSVVVQLANSLDHRSLVHLVPNSSEPPDRLVGRLSFFTQSIYLFFGLALALYTYHYLMLTGNSQHLWRVLVAGAVLVAAIGWAEFLWYALRHQPLPLPANRLTGQGAVFDLFQTIELFGWPLMRAKAFSGEPSMYVYSLLPIAVVLYYQQRYLPWALLMGAMLLSFSTSFYLGLGVFVGLDALRHRGPRPWHALGVLLLLATWVLAERYLMQLFDDTLQKLQLQNYSGANRWEMALAALQFWYQSDPLHLLLGYGWGTIRSTDGLGTLLVNIGLLGSLCMYAPLWHLMRAGMPKARQWGYPVGTGVLWVLFVVSVPEFAFAHQWVFLALGFYSLQQAAHASKNTLAPDNKTQNDVPWHPQQNRTSMTPTPPRQPARDALLGLAVGDALGVPVEFRSRHELSLQPVSSMRGWGTWNQPPGTWSDDTSLALCTAESLLQGLNLADMAQRFVDWMHHSRWTAHDEVFDIGSTTHQGINLLDDYLKTNQQQLLYELRNLGGQHTNGNGSLMRILPLLFYIKGQTAAQQFETIYLVSALTHYHLRAAICCFWYLKIAEYLLVGTEKNQAIEQSRQLVLQLFDQGFFAADERPAFENLLAQRYRHPDPEPIQSTGYVVDTLEAALWAFVQGNNFGQVALMAVNLGGDTDTIASVAGGLAGIYYGAASIPSDWLAVLARRTDIEALADALQKRYP